MPLQLSAGLLFLGFAFGGFFDGILLHQILQWHHLLSGLREGMFAHDLRAQVLADGAFHALMFVLAVIGLMLLLRARSSAVVPPEASGASLVTRFVIGFAGWHVLDAVVSHWLLGLHRIRMDTSSPLAWDLGWLAVFGIAPLLWALGPRRMRVPPQAPLLLAALTAVAGVVSLRPPPAGPTMAVLVPPGASSRPLLAWVARNDVRVVGTDGQGVWLLQPPRPVSLGEWWSARAWPLGGIAGGGGCAAWLRA